jgi:photosystem II stability/assembly factor-like uncharacterized protein
MIMMKTQFSCFLLFVFFAAHSQNNYSFDTINVNAQTSVRGMSVLNDQVAWISGSNGWVGRSKDGGHHWDMHQVATFEAVNFRSIYAFSDKKAIIASAGTPAVILLTNDGGISWTTGYSSTDTLMFFDGIDFRNEKDGIIYGDPIGGKMMIMRTSDGGLHWTESKDISRPALDAGESSFAASGTGVRMFGKKGIMICTGGANSRLFISNDDGVKWNVCSPPIIHGLKSTGIFSVAVHGKDIIIVGGDYLMDSLRADHVFYSNDAGNIWKKPAVPTRGYRECVEYINGKTWIAAGPTGIDISYDNGVSWQALSDEKGMHVVRKARNGKLVLIAGKEKTMVAR